MRHPSSSPVLPGVDGPVPEAGGTIPLSLPANPFPGVVDPSQEVIGFRYTLKHSAVLIPVVLVI